MTGLLAVTACSSAEGPTAAPTSKTAPDLDTIEPGVIKVAVQPYAPYTSVRGSKIIGLDGDILHAAADKLGLTVEPVETDFPGMLASVQSRRVDVAIGGIAWSAERQKQGLFTDPPYYSPTALAVTSGTTLRTVEDLENRTLGTVEGYVWAKAIQAVPGATLRAYPDGNGVLDDLAAGRISAGFLDPLLILAAQQQRPELKITTQYLEPPTEQQVKKRPAYAYFQSYMTGFYLPKESPKLEKALSAEIREMYANGELTKTVKKYGGTPDRFLKPTDDAAATRRGVDRPSSWTPPSV